MRLPRRARRLLRARRLAAARHRPRQGRRAADRGLRRPRWHHRAVRPQRAAGAQPRPRCRLRPRRVHLRPVLGPPPAPDGPPPAGRDADGRVRPRGGDRPPPGQRGGDPDGDLHEVHRRQHPRGAGGGRLRGGGHLDRRTRRLRRHAWRARATAEGAPLRCGRARVPAVALPALLDLQWSHGARHRSRVTRRDRLRLCPAAGVARGLGRGRRHDRAGPRRVRPSSPAWASRRWAWWPT